MPPTQLKFWTVPREWQGETVFIIAGGPSVTQEQVDRLRGRKVIAIKLSCEKCPRADILFFADGVWFKKHKAVTRAFAGRVVTVAKLPDQDKILILRKNEVPGLCSKPDETFVRRTSVTGAINLAVHLGAKKIVLLGIDGKTGHGGRTHHHTPHELPKRHGFFDEQRKDFEALVPGLKSAGVEVFNTNTESAHRMFAFIDLDAELLQ